MSSVSFSRWEKKEHNVPPSREDGWERNSETDGSLSFLSQNIWGLSFSDYDDDNDTTERRYGKNHTRTEEHVWELRTTEMNKKSLVERGKEKLSKQIVFLSFSTFKEISERKSSSRLLIRGIRSRSHAGFVCCPSRRYETVKSIYQFDHFLQDLPSMSLVVERVHLLRTTNVGARDWQPKLKGSLSKSLFSEFHVRCPVFLLPLFVTWSSFHFHPPNEEGGGEMKRVVGEGVTMTDGIDCRDDRSTQSLRSLFLRSVSLFFLLGLSPSPTGTIRFCWEENQKSEHLFSSERKTTDSLFLFRSPINHDLTMSVREGLQSNRGLKLFFLLQFVGCYKVCLNLRLLLTSPLHASYILHSLSSLPMKGITAWCDLRQRDRHHNNTSLFFFIFRRTVINYCYYSLLWQTLIAEGENLLSLMDFLPIAFLRSHFSRSSFSREVFDRKVPGKKWRKQPRSCVPWFSRLSPIDHFNCIFLSILSIPNGCDVFTPHHLHVLLPFFCLLNTIILLFQVDASLVYCVCFSSF